MPSLSQPRSLSKTLAIAAISLLAAGFLTVLGIGLRGLLWEIRMAQAETQKAQAMMASAQADMQKAQAAFEQARATIEASKKTAEGQVVAAQETARGNVEGQKVGNFSDYESTTKVVNPLLNDPSSEVTRLAAALSRINIQLEKGVDTNAEPLSQQQREQLQEAQRKTAIQLEMAQKVWHDSVTANGVVAKSLLTDLFQVLSDGMKSSKKTTTEPGSRSGDQQAASVRRRTTAGRRPRNQKVTPAVKGHTPIVSEAWFSQNQFSENQQSSKHPRCRPLRRPPKIIKAATRAARIMTIANNNLCSNTR